MRLVAAVILAILLNACSGKHVTFFHPNTVAEAEDEARLFLDARGDIYPQTGIAATYALPSDANGSLFEAARGADPALCLRAADGTEMAELCSVVVNDCSGTSTEGCFNRWVEVQERLWQRRGRVISSRFSGNGNATLGVLIHGFNNWYRESEASYSVGQKQMRRFANPAQPLYFIEIYWDGCRGNEKGIGCWGKAQSTGPLAGFALRQLFNTVEDSWSKDGQRPHWRILTHSSGAFVAGAAFGDPIAALPQLQDPSTNRWYGSFERGRRSVEGLHRVPQLSDVKLGMLAPATPSITFSGSEQHHGGVLSRGLTILSTVQSSDTALTKLIIGCQRFGASCLGAKPDQVCDLQTEFANSDRDTKVIGYDFHRDPTLWGNEHDLHDYSVYVRQAAVASTFFRDFMSTGTPSANSGPLIECK